ncbi:tyrosine-type recombinase/integrase [Bifidobacterium xylocopae]|uniref:Integrase n=1 Tax=Bifidobacterium xylocopae TaxID=2493119 RepID=A0A366KEC7_9BIFI|nr:tyrosine-type recombinase/integrase [Bifidobacterium xylocopae]RBQ00076.1 integrase [Bifidobacterium xylocopae]
MPRKRGNGVREPYRYTTSRGEQRWMASIDLGVSEDGKRRRKTVTAATYRACKQKLKDLTDEIRGNGAPINRHVRLGEYAHQWLTGRRNELDPNSYKLYNTIVNKHLADYSWIPIGDMVPSTIRKIIDNAKRHDRNGETTGEAGFVLKGQIRSCLNQIMQSALADRLIPSNPVLAVPAPKRKDKEMRRTAFSIPELKSMLDVASRMPVEDGAIWWWRLLTGMRQGEIIGALWEDYNSKAHTYTVNWQAQPLPRIHGCGPKSGGEWPCGYSSARNCPEAVWRVPAGFAMREMSRGLALTRPKSQTGRVVPVVPPLRMVMDRYRAATRDRPNPYGLIFRRPDGSPIKPHEDSVAFHDLMRQAGIDPSTHTGHETRHSVVTLLAAQGVDFQLIKEIVGHSSDAMVEHYRHADDAERLKAMETLDESLGLSEITARKRGVTPLS